MVKTHRWIDLIPEREWEKLPIEIHKFLIDEIQEKYHIEVFKKEEVETILKEIEDKLDKINVEYGSHDELCIFCKSKEYNSKVGIAHYEGCALSELRNIIRLK